MALFEIPLTPEPQSFRIDLGAIPVSMRVHYADAPEGGWLLDIADDQEAPLVRGIPLVTGVDLLQQHRHLGLGVKLFVSAEKPPAFSELGTVAHLVFEAL